MCSFLELVGGVQTVMSQALEHLKEQEIRITALKLGSLSLDDSEVCVCVLETGE